VDPAPPLNPVSLAGITVLLVDDSADGRELFEVALRAYGASVVALESAELALAVLENGTLPDVIVSDIGMAGCDGYALMRRVRALGRPVGLTPAIALTAYAEPEDTARALAAGYQLHLTKPTAPQRLADSIVTLIRGTDRSLLDG
jgi:CheY-like chemotaxis protein